jgi:hypothetical protein
VARTFGDPYDIEVPLRTTWQERFIVEDANGAPVNLTGYKVRGALREVLDYDADGNAIFGDVILELTTETGDDGTNLFITVGTDGAIDLKVSAYIIGTLSPTNVYLQVAYDMEIYHDISPDGTGQLEFVEPLLAGTVTFRQRVTEVA